MPGIESCKYSPMIRNDPSIFIEIHSLNLSPTNYEIKKGKIMQAMTYSNFQHTGEVSPKEAPTEASTAAFNRNPQMKSSNLTGTSS